MCYFAIICACWWRQKIALLSPLSLHSSWAGYYMLELLRTLLCCDECILVDHQHCICRSSCLMMLYFSSCTDFLFQEAFLTTYRTFISPKTLIEKLLYRFNKFIMMKPANDGPYSYTGARERLSGYSFSSSSNHYGSSDSLYHPSQHQKAARAASSLIARVVNDLW